MSVQAPTKRFLAPDITAMKGGNPIVSLTSYHSHTAAIADKYCDFLLVGDSLGMVMHGQRLGGAEAAGFELPPVDYVGLAKAVGADGIQVAKLDDLAAVRAWAAAVWQAWAAQQATVAALADRLLR